MGRWCARFWFCLRRSCTMRFVRQRFMLRLLWNCCIRQAWCMTMWWTRVPNAGGSSPWMPFLIIRWRCLREIIYWQRLWWKWGWRAITALSILFRSWDRIWRKGSCCSFPMSAIPNIPRIFTLMSSARRRPYCLPHAWKRVRFRWELAMKRRNMHVSLANTSVFAFKSRMIYSITTKARKSANLPAMICWKESWPYLHFMPLIQPATSRRRRLPRK